MMFMVLKIFHLQFVARAHEHRQLKRSIQFGILICRQPELNEVNWMIGRSVGDALTQ